jgi:hypothetical protein
MRALLLCLLWSYLLSASFTDAHNLVFGLKVVYPRGMNLCRVALMVCRFYADSCEVVSHTRMHVQKVCWLSLHKHSTRVTHVFGMILL